MGSEVDAAVGNGPLMAEPALEITSDVSAAPMGCHVAAAVGREPPLHGAASGHSVRDVRAVAEQVTPDQEHLDAVVLQLGTLSDVRRSLSEVFVEVSVSQKHNPSAAPTNINTTRAMRARLKLRGIIWSQMIADRILPLPFFSAM
jgi:hypothetical protein